MITKKRQHQFSEWSFRESLGAIIYRAIADGLSHYEIKSVLEMRANNLYMVIQPPKKKPPK